MTGDVPLRQDVRRRRYRSGLTAEMLAAAYLIAKRHRILARRYKTAAGEIDLIARTSRRIAFIEVKRRATLDAAVCALTPWAAERLQSAARQLAAEAGPNVSARVVLIALAPGRWPRHIPGVG